MQILLPILLAASVLTQSDAATSDSVTLNMPTPVVAILTQPGDFALGKYFVNSEYTIQYLPKDYVDYVS